MMKTSKEIKELIVNHMPDYIYLKRLYKKLMGKHLNLLHPQTFNEKLQWLKIHDRKPIYTTMVDKYEAKKYVASIIGDQYIIPTYGIWDHFDDIDFDKLPNQFVLKTTHDSGSIVIVRNKKNFDKNAAKCKLEKSLAYNFYYYGREWPYKNVKPRIIAEKYMVDESQRELKDYKVFTFNGKFDSVMVCTDRGSGNTKFRFYDRNWNRIMYQKSELEPEGDIDRPDNLHEIISIAEKLSIGHPHLRVDLYDVNNKIYFGELTFFDKSGFDTDITDETDLAWGKKMDLSLIRRNG